MDIIYAKKSCNIKNRLEDATGFKIKNYLKNIILSQFSLLPYLYQYPGLRNKPLKQN
jgi:hypothetical protein